MLNIAVQVPIPRANVSTATAVKPGLFNNWRTANLRSFMMLNGCVRCGTDQRVATSMFPPEVWRVTSGPPPLTLPETELDLTLPSNGSSQATRPPDVLARRSALKSPGTVKLMLPPEVLNSSGFAICLASSAVIDPPEVLHFR